MYKTTIALLVLLNTSEAIAAGKGGSVKDLIWPAFNFLVLFIFLGFKLKKPMADMFTENAKSVQELYDVAEKKDKEAQIKLETYQKKLSSFDAESQKIMAETQNEANLLKKNIEQETEQMISKLQKDAVDKVEHEKASMMRELNESLIDEVIRKTKEAIKGDQGLQSKATNKLASQVK